MMISFVLESFLFKYLSIFSILYFGFWLWSRRKFYLLSMKIPGPISYPILGNSIALGCFGNHTGVVEGSLKIVEKYGDFFSLWHGPDFTIVTTNAEDFEEIILNKSTSTRGKKYDILKTCLGTGLLTASGPLWKKHRHLINPSFSIAALKTYQSTHNKHSKILTDSLKSLVGEKPVDISPFAMRCCGDSCMENLFGEELHYYEGHLDDILIVTPICTELMYERIAKVWLMPDILYKLSPQSKLSDKLLKRHRSFYYKMFRNKVEKYLNNKNNDENHNVGEKGQKNVFENLMSEFCAGGMTFQEVLDEFDNIFNPGMDTTYSQFSCFIVMMAMHKDYQNQLYKELSDFYGSSEEITVTSDHFSKLKYLDMCLKEVMRMFPIGVVQLRLLEEDFHLKKRDLIIPAGSTICLFNYGLHHNPKYYENPHSYCPDRFSPENSQKRPHFAFLPFSAGPRSCIGQNFGTKLMKTMIIHVFMKYEFHSDLKMEDVKVKNDISARIGNGYFVTIKKREVQC